MALTEDEVHKLKVFSKIKLDRNQIEVIIGRKLTRSEWKTLLPKDYSKIFTPIAKQAAKTASIKGYLKPNYSKIFRDIADRQVKREWGITPSSNQQDNSNLKLIFKDVAKQAAKVATRK